jgi:hypothetical protein
MCAGVRKEHAPEWLTSSFLASPRPARLLRSWWLRMRDFASLPRGKSRILPWRLRSGAFGQITIFEIKSTRKKLKPDFSGYFFALTAAEVLVAQSLKKNFKFVFVNTTTGDFLELDLVGIFAKARGIYPTWSISF